MPKRTHCRAIHSHHDHVGALPGDHSPQPPRRRLETIDDLIADMFEKLTLLSAMLDQAEDVDSFMKIFAVYGRCTTYLASLLRTKQSLPGSSADDLMSALSQAIDEVGKELRVDLSRNIGWPAQPSP